MKKAKAKVLLVEDDPTLVDMYKMKFEEEGYDMDTAMRGEEGLEKGLKGDHDIILLDIILPEIDGFAILKGLRENSKTRQTPIVMLSNLGQESDLVKGKELGASDYLVKANFTPAEVVKKVEDVLKKQK